MTKGGPRHRFFFPTKARKWLQEQKEKRLVILAQSGALPDEQPKRKRGRKKKSEIIVQVNTETTQPIKLRRRKKKVWYPESAKRRKEAEEQKKEKQKQKEERRKQRLENKKKLEEALAEAQKEKQKELVVMTKECNRAEVLTRNAETQKEEELFQTNLNRNSNVSDATIVLTESKEVTLPPTPPQKQKHKKQKQQSSSIKPKTQQDQPQLQQKDQTPHVAPEPKHASLPDWHGATCLYRLAPPILPTRMHELFDRVGGIAALQPADAAALACFFPALHNDEWFIHAEDFVTHCKSISHRLLCEKAPLYPLEASPRGTGGIFFASKDGWSSQRRAHASNVHHPVGNCSASQGGDDGLKMDNNNNAIKEARQRWWFVRLHATAGRFFAREWQSFWHYGDNDMNNVYNNIDMCDVAELWQSCCAFQTAAATALARQIVLPHVALNKSHMTEQWSSLSCATNATLKTLRYVYARRSDSSLIIDDSDGRVRELNDEREEEEEEKKEELTIRESDGLHALAKHMAMTIVRTLHQTMDRHTDFDKDTNEEAEESLTEIFVTPVKSEAEEDEEESCIEQLVLWLFLRSHVAL